MSQFSKYDPFSSDRFLNEGKAHSVEPSSGRIVKPTAASSFKAHTFLFPLNESEEFHDPFSEINLFLARRIKREILREKNPRKWSHKIQSLLLREILPDFTKKFPGYRLGSTALEKTWNKVLYYLQMIQQKKGALKPNGKLNVDYLIKENLKHLESSSTDFHPYNTAHSLAVKISECIAAIDGERPQLEELTKTIWAVQKHLIPHAEKIPKAPFDSIDGVDKLIVRFQLEALAEEPKLSRNELVTKVKKRLLHLKGLEKIRNIEEITSGIMALLAEKLYPHLNLHRELTQDNLDQITEFVKLTLKKAKLPATLEKEKAHTLLAARILFLYKLASQTTLDEVGKGMEAAIQYVYGLSTDAFQINTPVLKQEVYEFIDLEISYLKEERVADPLQKLLETTIDLFSAAEKLPRLDPSHFEEIEIVIWKVIADQSECLAKLPAYLRKIIFEELASIHIENNKKPFRKIVQATLHSLKTLRSVDLTDAEQKIEIWSHQNDMIASSLYFDQDLPLLKCIEKEYEKVKKTTPRTLEIAPFIDRVGNLFLGSHKELSGWLPQLKLRITILFKYFWYQRLKEAEQSSFDRFVLYQYNMMTTHQEKQFPELVLQEMEIELKERLPLFPLNKELCRTLVQR